MSGLYEEPLSGDEQAECELIRDTFAGWQYLPEDYPAIGERIYNKMVEMVGENPNRAAE